jgi:hypothetical protein
MSKTELLTTSSIFYETLDKFYRINVLKNGVSRTSEIQATDQKGDPIYHTIKPFFLSKLVKHRNVAEGFYTA